MRCAWKELLAILPPWLRPDVELIGKEKLQEIRLRLDAYPELVADKKSIWLRHLSTGSDLSYCVNAASRYSPWNADTAARGFITAPGGHRIGLCGSAVTSTDHMTGIREISSICIRIAKDITGIANQASSLSGSILILGAPGWGKTTLLRDLIRQLSNKGSHICVVDDRSELFPTGFDKGKRTDVMTGCKKSQGIPAVLRSMGPDYIAMDEITAEEDCKAMLQAAYCGVRLLASAHASSYDEFIKRKIYRSVVSEKVFDWMIVLRQDKSWYTERIV